MEPVLDTLWPGSGAEDGGGESPGSDGDVPREESIAMTDGMTSATPPADHATSTDGGEETRMSSVRRELFPSASQHLGENSAGGQRSSLTTSSNTVNTERRGSSLEILETVRERGERDIATVRERARLAMVVAVEEQMEVLSMSTAAAMDAMDEEIRSLRSFGSIMREKLKAVEQERDSLRNTVASLSGENAKLREQLMTHIQLQQKRIIREQSEQRQRESSDQHSRPEARDTGTEQIHRDEGNGKEILQLSDSEMLLSSSESVGSDTRAYAAVHSPPGSSGLGIDVLSPGSPGVIGNASGGAVPGPTPAKLKRIMVLRKLSETAFNAQNAKHAELLSKLTKNTFGDNIPGDPLAALGFTVNLEKDLEKTGVLSLLNMVYLSERYQAFIAKIVARNSYPFAQAGLSITSLLATLLDLEGHKVSTDISKVFLNLMDTHPKTFEEMYCAGVRLYDNATKDPDVTPSQALHTTGQALRSMLSKKPQTLEDLMRMAR